MSEFVEGDLFDPEYVAEQVTAETKAAVEAEEQTVATLRVRQEAYRRLFNRVDEETRRIVMSDLAAFCRANTTTFHENDRVHCLLSGRNEVYQRIADHLRLPLDVLFQRYSGREG